MANILYFSTTWCGPCKMFKPVVQQVAAAAGKQITYLDAEEHRDMAAKYNITGVPTIIVAEGDNILHRHTGVMPPAQLKTLLSSIN